ncbi:Down syndrome cell adhesion molecule-like protein Dscam2 [Varroa jacobsoni]|uniref:Down syndrome cell adhesion molecule-like protein Dscam2 n=1 Tax=Varroa jacobsoni TaxID=62625 RepID=UPI000BF88585|nr:Down syndrome cell adhesion molecule-like protein Dscam2 [Varroa jacobsoni]
MLECVPRITLTEGETLRLSCAASGHPSPTYRWFRVAPHSAQQNAVIPQPLRAAASEQPLLRQLLIINKMTLADSASYICVANNSYGEDNCHTQVVVTAPLDAVMLPRLLSVRSGDDATVNCTYRGGPVAQVFWTKDQRPLITDHRVRLLGRLVLHISAFRRSDQGVYQCYVSGNNDNSLRSDSAQGYAYLKVQEVAPVLSDTFSASVRKQGERLSLRCVATGSPLPQVSWLLDGQPVSESGSTQQGDFVQPDGFAVVSFVNISALRVTDGGDYSCRASNDVGTVEHTARIDVAGPPFIRAMRNLTAITGSDFRLHCPVSGYPIEAVHLEKEGRTIRVGSRHRMTKPGQLLIQDVRREDQGVYRCVVQGAQGEVFTRDVYVHVVVPPKLAPFAFPSRMQAGHRATVTCAIVEGDSPIIISWQKNGRPLLNHKGIQTLPLSDFVSTLMIDHVERTHSGNFTCIATNRAAVTNYTAPLIVLAPPSWSIKPEDKTVIVGSAVRFDCRADGEPQPIIRWKVAKGDDFHPIVSSPRIHVLENGSLTILSVERADQGQYVCEASNGVGTSATTALALAVKAKPRVSGVPSVVKLKKDSQAQIQCEAIGDSPLELIWSFNGTLIRPEHDVRIRMDDQMMATDKLVSTLQIDQVRSSDSGVIECTVTNPYGRESIHTRLVVQDKPSPPTKLRIIETTSTSITLQWETPPDGNSPIKSYVITYRQQADSSTPEESILSQHRASFVSDDGSQSATMKNLLPRTTYQISVAASNDIGTSHTSDTLNVTTKVDPPQKPPRDIEVLPVSSSKLRVRWRRPLDPPSVPIGGYYIGYRANQESVFAYATHSLLNLAPRDVEEFFVTGLKKRANYCVIAQAYNEQGNGPSSKETCATTFEYDPPESPRLKLISSTATSLHISWEARPSDKVQGFIAHYKHGNGGFVEERLSRQLSSKLLSGLQCGTTYTVYLTAYNDVGHSEPSEFLEAATNGKPPVAPAVEALVADVNQTALKLSLSAWREAGCPILFYEVRYRPRDSQGDWIVYSNHIPREQQTVYIAELTPSSWYDLSVWGYSEAGHSEAAYLVGTLTPDGRRPPPPPQRINTDTATQHRGHLQGIQGGAWMVPLICVVAAIVVIIGVISVLVLSTRKRDQRLQELYNQTDPGNSMTLKTYPSMGQMGGAAMMGTIARHNAGTMASCKTLSACSKQCNGSTMGPAFYYPANYSATVRGEGQLYPNPTANGEDDRQHTYEDPCKLKEQQMRAAAAAAENAQTLKRKVQMDSAAFEGGKHRMQYSDNSNTLEEHSPPFLGSGGQRMCGQGSMDEFEEMSDFGENKQACYTSYGYKVPRPYPSTINEESSVYSDCTYRSS